MPVKSPEILQVEKVTGLNPAEVENVALKTSDADSIHNEQPTQNEASIQVVSEEKKTNSEIDIPKTEPKTFSPSNGLSEIKVSALSLASIRAKKELVETNKAIVRKDEIHLTEEFTETDMLLQWNKYAQRLADKGQKIMESFLLINDPKLQGSTIIHELPNEGSKIEFESQKHDLLGYLRGKLHNHDIEIKILVNESMDNRKAFTPQDRYNRLNEINPSLELLRKTFDLDI